MRVSCTLASAELVTIKQLMMPSEIASAIACLNKLCTIIGRTSSNRADSPAPARSASAAFCSSACGAGARRSASPAQRLIVRSSCDAVFCRARHRTPQTTATVVMTVVVSVSVSKIRQGISAPLVERRETEFRGDAYLDGKVVDGTSACYARTLGGLRTSGRALERGDAGLQPCDLPLLFFELRALFLYFLMRDCLNELKR